MINVAIVEDEWECVNPVKECFEKYSQEYGEEFNITRFPNGTEFLSNYKTGFDIVIMDVDMPGMNGFATAKKMREIDPSAALIFVTYFAKYAIKGYEVDALDYVVKPVDYPEFKMKIDRAIKRHKANRSSEVVVKYKEGVVRIPLSELLYVEIANHDLVYHTVKEDYHAYGTMKMVEGLLPDSSFSRCNNCYLVNLRLVTKVEDGYVHVGNAKLGMSRLRTKPFLQALHNYAMGD